jgi:hypothetical protein
MKKVVRLNESDLEKIIRKVISEQMSTGVAFGKEGNGFKMKREPKEQVAPKQVGMDLKNLDDSQLMVFTDILPENRNWVAIFNYLKSKGLGSQRGRRSMEPNPLVAKGPFTDQLDKNADRIDNFFKSGLAAVAQNNYTDQSFFKRGFPIKDQMSGSPTYNKDISGVIKEYFPNFYDVLWEVVKDNYSKVRKSTA